MRGPLSHDLVKSFLRHHPREALGILCRYSSFKVFARAARGERIVVWSEDEMRLFPTGKSIDVVWAVYGTDRRGEERLWTIGFEIKTGTSTDGWARQIRQYWDMMEHISWHIVNTIGFRGIKFRYIVLVSPRGTRYVVDEAVRLGVPRGNLVWVPVEPLLYRAVELVFEKEMEDGEKRILMAKLKRLVG